MTIQRVLRFWFDEAGPDRWWVKDSAFDREIEQQFGDLHQQAARCELFSWRECAEGRLAEVILLDQFSRNIFRDCAQAFQYDSLALALAQEAVAATADKQLSAVQCSFLYMPYMHSESLSIHQQAEMLYQANGIENNYTFELRHRAIIEQFGRYPHRNRVLGRESTSQEILFLQQPGSSF